ncbi:MAG: ATP-binding protein [Burkholderiales bacterium]|nr:ATP-binding protein [Burkholderiales bacterium]
MSAREFDRNFDSLSPIFAFTREAFARDTLDMRLLPTVDLALEELFTNVVKYATETRSRVRIEIGKVPNGVEVTLTDRDVDFFDVTRTADVDVSLPIEQRSPGGLGLHLIKKMVDFIEYQYLQDTRTSRITFRATAQERRRKPRDRNMLAIDFGANGEVVVAGRFDAAQCAAAQSFLDKVQGPVTLDCSRLEYISSAGLGVLLKTQKRLMAASGGLKLAGVNRHLRDIFQYSGFDQIFEIEAAAD